MQRDKVVRGLRIAWTAVFGILCVVLVVLWVRSYWCADTIGVNWRTLQITLFNNVGEFGVKVYDQYSTMPDFWQVNTEKVHPQGYFFLHKLAPLHRACGIAWGTFGNGWQAGMSHWLATLFTIVLVGFTLPKPLPQFSVRTLLIATTLVAVVLGGLAWLEQARVRADREAVKQAYLDGRMTLEEARKCTDENVDTWPPPNGP